MFTGIIEEIGLVQQLDWENSNLHLTIKSEFTRELKVDQSVSHNGVCLTVVAINDNSYMVTAINETIMRSNIGSLKISDPINLERGMKLGDRLDGHIVQGHVDQIGTCVGIEEQNGSWLFSFEYDETCGNITIVKGSITINGVSLTVVDSCTNTFSVAVIPYTFERTNFNTIQKGTIVNLEFDVIGKYVSKIQEARQ